MRMVGKFGLAGAASTLALVLGMTAASACTSLASLNLTPPSGPGGTQITITGSSFNTVSSGSTPVAIHLNSASGPLLATVTPDASGAIGPVAVTIPAGLQPGSYTVIASQTDQSTGQASFGTPARGAFQVTGSAAAQGNQAPVQPGLAAASPNSSGLSAGLIGLLIALAVVGLGLFGLGAATFVGNARRVPSASRVRK